MISRYLLVSVIIFLNALPAGANASAKLTFEKDIAPILKTHCFKCHGGEVRKAGLDLRRRFTLIAGGDSGAAILPGKPERSLLIEMIDDGLMPPEDERPLSDEQVAVLRKWIELGAPITGKEELPLEASEAETEVSEADRQFWAFQTPMRSPVPVVKSNNRIRTPIDAFVLAKLEENGLNFNHDVDRRVLLRRLCIDLHGLPPTPVQIDEFLADDQPDAYERLVDRLLSSPRYGERWGRHWLDVAGYADSDGYLEADRLRPEAWRYRDYVIRSLNNDKPFDRFVLEQIAGDELADWRRAEELTPEMIDNLIATGFMRTASDPTYGNYREPLECHKVMADTMQIVSSTFLGLTVQCARCHSHKMEPISQRDYYRMNAVLLASYDPKRWQVSLARAIPMATESQVAAFTKNNQVVDKSVAELNKQLNALIDRYRSKYLDEQLAAVPEDVRGEVRLAILADEKKRNEKQKQIIAKFAKDVTVEETKIAARFNEFKSEVSKLRADIAVETAKKKTIVQLRGLMDMDDKPAQAHILVRGDFNKIGAKVDPGIPAVLADADIPFESQAGFKTTGRRHAFANWLIHPRNPLTARVHMNRIWAHHFGRGIVSTVANFGRSGSAPSHPELLDWLATEFIARGWSQKEIHRLMLTSTVYRQTSELTDENAANDPENILLSRWQARRCEGEVIRDGMLHVAGKLNLQMYGKPVPVNRKADGEVVNADDAAGNRRSIYLIVRRSQPPTLLNLFDTPRMEINCPERDRSIVVTQALTLMNSPFTEQISRALVEQVSRNEVAIERRVERVFELLLARNPTSGEIESVTSFLDETAASESAAARKAWYHLLQVLLNGNEFVYVH